MSEVIISNWFGGFGNNLLQVCRALYYAEEKKFDLVKLPPHTIFKAETILTAKGSTSFQRTQTGVFFDLSDMNIAAPCISRLRGIAQTYMHRLLGEDFAQRVKKQSLELGDNVRCIHLRGGDVFSWRPHPYYVQPPLDYYRKVCSNQNQTILIAEDKKNPVYRRLAAESYIKEWSTGELSDDLSILCSSSILVCGFGTFGLAVYLLSDKLRKLVLPGYAYDEFPIGDKLPDPVIERVDLPNYIIPGKWRNTRKQRAIMLEYKI